MAEADKKEQSPDEVTQKEFLESVPPGVAVICKDLEAPVGNGNRVKTPDIRLHCESCDGERTFHSDVGEWIRDTREDFSTFLYYLCRNCRSRGKKFAVFATHDTNTQKWTVSKYGERPAFGQPVPARAITLIGSDRELFLKGRRCENQGLGIGAFAYYRRVVENQKNRIIDEITRVSTALSADAELLRELAEAKTKIQFTAAVESIKHGLPQSLLINGYNPLTLLHSALSEGIHQYTDAECLELASSIRLVLFELAERLGNAMKDEKTLNDAVNRLAGNKQKR